MANELAEETSPYLLQHKDNPVHWLPWGEAALAGECWSASCPARADLNVAAGNETGKEGATI